MSNRATGSSLFLLGRFFFLLAAFRAGLGLLFLAAFLLTENGLVPLGKILRFTQADTNDAHGKPPLKSPGAGIAVAAVKHRPGSRTGRPATPLIVLCQCKQQIRRCHPARRNLRILRRTGWQNPCRVRKKFLPDRATRCLAVPAGRPWQHMSQGFAAEIYPTPVSCQSEQAIGSR